MKGQIKKSNMTANPSNPGKNGQNEIDVIFLLPSSNLFLELRLSHRKKARASTPRLSSACHGPWLIDPRVYLATHFCVLKSSSSSTGMTKSYGTFIACVGCRLDVRNNADTRTLGPSFGIETVLVLSTEGCSRTAKSQRKQRKHVLVLFGTFFFTTIFGGFATQKSGTYFLRVIPKQPSDA